MSPNNDTLTIKLVNRRDTGDYCCLVQNPVSNATATFNIEVVYGPDDSSIIPPGPVTAFLGQTIILYCSATSSPAAEYKWYRGNTVLQAGPAHTIANITWNQSGNYTCLAHNKVTDNFIYTSVDFIVTGEDHNCCDLYIQTTHLPILNPVPHHPRPRPAPLGPYHTLNPVPHHPRPRQAPLGPYHTLNPVPHRPRPRPRQAPLAPYHTLNPVPHRPRPRHRQAPLGPYHTLNPVPHRPRPRHRQAPLGPYHTLNPVPHRPRPRHRQAPLGPYHTLNPVPHRPRPRHRQAPLGPYHTLNPVPHRPRPRPRQAPLAPYHTLNPVPHHPHPRQAPLGPYCGTDRFQDPLTRFQIASCPGLSPPL
uniref:Ig-like domain-containing protein n=1 Tax=Callorhinchus milii TaxID=7868 RepID=A0A4W3GXS1_CALMI